jgi:hypothetical protein
MFNHSHNVSEFLVDSCSGQDVSNNNVQIDFGLIETRCDCKVKSNFSGQYYYSLATNPGYDNCGTAIKISIDSNTSYTLICSATPQVLAGVSSNINHTVKFIPSVNQYIPGNSGYCVRVLSNGEYSYTLNVMYACTSYQSGYPR